MVHDSVGLVTAGGCETARWSASSAGGMIAAHHDFGEQEKHHRRREAFGDRGAHWAHTVATQNPGLGLRMLGLLEAAASRSRRLA